MLMVDRILHVEPGQRAVAVKCVSVNEPYFPGHYPGQPIMPGVLILEAMAQVGGIALSGEEQPEKIPLLAGVKRTRFRRPSPRVTGWRSRPRSPASGGTSARSRAWPG